jgi:hypothetical protein
MPEADGNTSRHIGTVLHRTGSSLSLKTVLCGCYFYFELAQNKLVHVPYIMVIIIHFCYKSIKKIKLYIFQVPSSHRVQTFLDVQSTKRSSAMALELRKKETNF